MPVVVGLRDEVHGRDGDRSDNGDDDRSLSPFFLSPRKRVQRLWSALRMSSGLEWKQQAAAGEPDQTVECEEGPSIEMRRAA